jgi:hypothetical protein
LQRECRSSLALAAQDCTRPKPPGLSCESHLGIVGRAQDQGRTVQHAQAHGSMLQRDPRLGVRTITESTSVSSGQADHRA